MVNQLQRPVVLVTFCPALGVVNVNINLYSA